MAEIKKDVDTFIDDDVESNKIPVDTKDKDPKTDKPADKPAGDDKDSKTEEDPKSDGKAEPTGDDKSGAMLPMKSINFCLGNKHDILLTSVTSHVFPLHLVVGRA